MDLQSLLLAVLCVALIAAILSGVPVMLAISGVPVLVGFLGYLLGVFDPAFIAAFPQRVFGVMNNSLLIAVPFFVFMGATLESSRIAERMLMVLASFFGPRQGGLAYAVIVLGALIAAATGIIGTTIVMMVLISLTTMLRARYSPSLAAGVICASGTLGQIIPPSIVLILLGDQVSNAYQLGQRSVGNWAPDPVSVGHLFAGAVIPGLLLVSLYLCYVWWRGRTRPQDCPVAEYPALGQSSRRIRVPGFDEPVTSLEWSSVINAFLPPILLVVAVLGSILFGLATPTEASSVGAVGAILISGSALARERGQRPWWAALALLAVGVLISTKVWGFDRGHLGWTLVAIAASLVLAGSLLAALRELARKGILRPVARNTLSVTAMIFGIIISASMLSLVFRGLGGDDAVAELLTGLPGGQWGALAAVMLTMFLLGFVLEFVEIIYIIIPVVGPVILTSDFHPVWFAVLVALNLQTSFLTPPFGFALFYFRGAAPSDFRTVDIYRGVLPFIGLQILAIVIVAAVPGLATWLPEALFG